MSIFSRIRDGRKAAKEHKEKIAAKEGATPKQPYKHVPTHAAVDALSGAPSTWKAEDRTKIRDQHKRRSQMAISRTGSSLSTMSYMGGPSSHSAHAPPLPRNSSYSSYNPAWFDKADQNPAYYPNEQHAQKRYRMSRGQSSSSVNGHQYHDSGIGPSPLSSNPSEEVSPVVSSGNSTSSNSSEPLEMGNSKATSSRPQPIVYAEKDIFSRLHTSTTRKLGEAPISDSPPVVIKTPTAAAVVPEPKQKKARWSLMGKKATAPIAS